MKRIIGFLTIFALIFMPALSQAAIYSDDGQTYDNNSSYSNYSEGQSYGGSWQGGEPRVRTLGATNIGDTYVTLQAYYDSADTDYNGEDRPRLYVEWGEGNDLDRATSSIPQNLGTRTMLYTLSGLQSSTTYSYRAVLLFKDQRLNGTVMRFTTLARGQAPIGQQISDDRSTALDRLGNLLGVNRTLTNSNNRESSADGVTVRNGSVSLTIDPASDTLIQGEQTSYQVRVKNTGTAPVRRTALQFLVPDEASHVKNSRGSYDRSLRIVRVRLGSIGAGQTEDVSIVLRGERGSDNDTVALKATVDYTNNNGDQTVTATAQQEFDGKSGSVLGASVMGAGFLPQTLIGWIFVLAIIMIIVFIVRRYQKAKVGGDKK